MLVARKIDSKGFYIEDIETDLLENTDEIIVTDIVNGYVKPKWNGAEWIEGATAEEIAEWEANQPKPCTEMTQAEITEYLADLDYRITMKELGL